MKSSIKTAALFLSTTWLLAVTALASPPQHATPPATVDAPHVLATIAPLYALTAGVMADIAPPQLLLGAGATPHHYSIRPDDVRKLVQSQLLVCTSKTHEYYLQPLLNLNTDKQHTVIEALSIPGMILHHSSANGHSHNAAPQHATKHHTTDEHTADEHADTLDMHFWLDPHNAITFTRYITETLSQLDPHHEDKYRRNADEQITRLQKLDAHIREQLGGTPRIARYASFHDSLGYFEQRYGIRGSRTITRTPETGASVAEVAALHAAIESSAIRCLFHEPEFSGKLLEATVATYPEHASLHTVDALGSSYPDGTDFYDSMLRELTAVVKACSDPVTEADTAISDNHQREAL